MELFKSLLGPLDTDIKAMMREPEATPASQPALAVPEETQEEWLPGDFMAAHTRSANQMDQWRAARGDRPVPAPRWAQLVEPAPQPAQLTNTEALPVEYDQFRRILESGGDPNAKAPTSSATGADQFLSSTWLTTVKQANPSWARGLSQSQLLDLRRDPAKSDEMADYLTNQNAAFLRKRGVPVDNVSLYAAHHFGPSRAASFAAAPANTPSEAIFPAAVIKANPYLKGKTKQQVVDNWMKRASQGAARGVAKPAPAPTVAPAPQSGASEPAGADPAALGAGLGAAAAGAGIISQRTQPGASTFEVPDGTKVAFLSDAESALSHSWQDKITRKMKVLDVLEHDSLYELFPEVKDIRVEWMPADGSGGEFVGSVKNGTALIRLSESLKFNDTQVRSVLLHELQHAVQDVEGRSGGGSPGITATRQYVNKFYPPDLLDGFTRASDNLAEALSKAGLDLIPGSADEKTVSKMAKLVNKLALSPSDVESLQRIAVYNVADARDLSNLVGIVESLDEPGAPKVPTLLKAALRGMLTSTRNLDAHQRLPTDFQVYTRLYGEAEARLVQQLRDKTLDEIAAAGIRPDAFTDVKPEEVMVQKRAAAAKAVEVLEPSQLDEVLGYISKLSRLARR